MVSRLGADVADLEAIAADLDGYARRLDGARAGIDREVARVNWTGPDAEAFRRRWRAISLRDLEGFRADLVSSAAELRRQVLHQRIASSEGIGAASGLVAAHGLGWAAGGVLGASGGNSAVTGLEGGLLVGGAVGVVGGLSTSVLAAGGNHLVAGVVRPGSRHGLATFADRSQTVVGGLLDTAEQLHGIPAIGKAASKGTLKTMGTVLTVGSAGIQGFFDQWSRDEVRGLSGGERGLRAGDAAVVHGAAVFAGGKVGAVAGGVVGAGAGALYGGAMGAAGGAVLGSLVGPVGTVVGAKMGAVVGAKFGALAGAKVGTVAGAWTGADLASSLLNSDTGARLVDGYVEMRSAVRSGVGDAAGIMQDATSTVADSAVDAVGGAVDSVKGWFGR